MKKIVIPTALGVAAAGIWWLLSSGGLVKPNEPPPGETDGTDGTSSTDGTDGTGGTGGTSGTGSSSVCVEEKIALTWVSAAESCPTIVSSCDEAPWRMSVLDFPIGCDGASCLYRQCTYLGLGTPKPGPDSTFDEKFFHLPDNRTAALFETVTDSSWKVAEWAQCVFSTAAGVPNLTGLTAPATPGALYLIDSGQSEWADHRQCGAAGGACAAFGTAEQTPTGYPYRPSSSVTESPDWKRVTRPAPATERTLQHGLILSEVARLAACTDARCDVEVIAPVVLDRQPDQVPFRQRAGFTGHIAAFDRAIGVAMKHWRDRRAGPQVPVINLSVGWSNPKDLSSAAGHAVHRAKMALLRAHCGGALLIAATGNIDTVCQGRLPNERYFPAFWRDRFVPQSACAAIKALDSLGAPDTYSKLVSKEMRILARLRGERNGEPACGPQDNCERLLWAVGGLDSFGRPLETTPKWAECGWDRDGVTCRKVPGLFRAAAVGATAARHDLSTSPPASRAASTPTATGSSVAAAVVSTAAALMSAHDPTRSRADIMTALQSTASDVGGQSTGISICRALDAVVPGPVPCAGPVAQCGPVQLPATRDARATVESLVAEPLAPPALGELCDASTHRAPPWTTPFPPPDGCGECYVRSTTVYLRWVTDRSLHFPTKALMRVWHRGNPKTYTLPTPSNRREVIPLEPLGPWDAVELVVTSYSGSVDSAFLPVGP